jgi:UPF0042 nucleotide-binding protein
MNIISFGYKYGAPKCDLLVDLTKYPSPTGTVCKKYNGTHAILRNEILNKPEYKELLNDLMNVIEKHTDSFTIAIGCEHGQHRSVAVVEELHKLIGSNVSKIHRDLDRKNNLKRKQKEYDDKRRSKTEMYDE